MRFKLDENLSRSVAEMFRTRGHDVMTVRDQELQGVSDEQVFEVSVREGPDTRHARPRSRSGAALPRPLQARESS